MITNQIVPADIKDESILDALSLIPRHLFVPDKWKPIACADREIPIGNQRFMLKPTLFAKMLQIAEIQSNDHVLDIGCTNGYSSAVLAQLCAQVVAVESCSDLTSKAHLLLKNLNIDNAIIIEHSLNVGHQEGAPYQVILVNGAVESIPDSLWDQLASPGRLVTIEQKARLPHQLVCYKKDKVIEKTIHLECQAPILTL